MSRPAPGARARSRAAWGVAVPLLVLAAAGVGLPFVWRATEALAPCVSAASGGSASCAAGEVLSDDGYRRALLATAWLSAASTLVALAVGTAAAVAIAARPAWRRVASVLASLGANVAGVPLALALTLLFGTRGIVTESFGGSLLVDLQSDGGLFVAYLCFQVPLAALLLMPAVALMDAGLPEAAATLGASSALYWRRVGLPLLAPALVEAGSLLFANAAAAYATPFALSGTTANVLAVRIASLVSGDIFSQPELATLLALVLFALLVAVIAGARWLASRWRVRLEG